MSTAFQCESFQTNAFQCDCKKRKGEATYSPVAFRYNLRRDEELITLMIAAARSESRKRGKMRIV